MTLPAVDEQLEALPNAGSGGGATPGLSPLITPNDGFYRIDTAFTVPSIDPATWQLTIGGGSRGPLTLSYADLLAREQIEIDCTLSCVSNEAVSYTHLDVYKRQTQETEVYELLLGSSDGIPGC